LRQLSNKKEEERGKGKKKKKGFHLFRNHRQPFASKTCSRQSRRIVKEIEEKRETRKEVEKKRMKKRKFLHANILHLLIVVDGKW